MADAQPNVTPINPKIGAMEAFVEGKIVSIEQPKESEWTYYTLRLKSADEYSGGGTIQISQQASERPFGREDDEVKCKVRLGGYGRRYNGRLYITNTMTFIERF